MSMSPDNTIDAQFTLGATADMDVDMGYEDASPTIRQQSTLARRGSMSEEQQRERRAFIKAIMADGSMSPMSKRRLIQHLMDGRRSSISGGSTSSNQSVSSSASASSQQENEELGYEKVSMDHHGHPRSMVISNDQTRRMEETRPHCPHYERNCTMIAPCCGAAFGCRICHDDCPVLPPKIEKHRRFNRSASLPSSFTSLTLSNDGNNDDTHHTIDRFAVTEIICRQCYTKQSSKTNNCMSCGVQFGAYHCSICNLWMSDEESPYHCEKCGFCRVGGQENFLHCDECGMCIDRTLYESHNCQSGKYRSNCPVCQEYLFSSRAASHEMPCGHAIHWDCFRQLAAHDSRCPLCKKTAETRDRMLPTWSAMASEIALQPIPPDLARVVNITCNDCEESAYGRAWHFLGIQCENCQSFNTVVDAITMSGEEAHEYLEVRRARQTVQEEADGQVHPEGAPRRRVNRRRSAF